MLKRPLLTYLIPLSIIAVVLAGAAISAARYVRPAPAPNGRYGAVEGNQVILFKVRNRVVSDFTFNIDMDCHNSETGEDYVRDFDAHELEGGRVGFDGRWGRHYSGESNLRQGNGRVEVHFTRNRGVFASVSTVVPGDAESFETCYGFTDLKVEHGPLG
jgi:hypothetical protein